MAIGRSVRKYLTEDGKIDEVWLERIMRKVETIVLNKAFVPRTDKKLIYKEVDGKNRIWVYPINVPNPADHLHCSADPKENVPGYRGFRGYGGSVLKFELEDGKVLELRGPWHSNSYYFKTDTGIDFMDKHLTYAIIAEQRQLGKNYQTELVNILYQDTEAEVGFFERGKDIGENIAEQLGQSVFVYSESTGGSSCGPVGEKK